MSIVVQQRFFRQINAMSALATYLAALSNRADRLLETHHQELFGLGLDVSFNRATLATKYWLPLPESDVPTHRTDAPKDEYSPNENDEQLFSELRECERILALFDPAFVDRRFQLVGVSTLDKMYAVR